MNIRLASAAMSEGFCFACGILLNEKLSIFYRVAIRDIQIKGNVVWQVLDDHDGGRRNPNVCCLNYSGYMHDEEIGM